MDLGLDTKQIRRDAEDTIQGVVGWSWASDPHAPRIVTPAELARHCLDLLAALEQAERERDELADVNQSVAVCQEHVHEIIDPSGFEQGCAVCAVEAEHARLAKVPALVEALERIAEGADGYPRTHIRALARQALADYEGE